MKALKECPILIGLVIIAIALSVVSFVFKDSVYAAYREPVENGEVPYLSLFFKGALDGIYPFTEPAPAFADENVDGIPDDKQVLDDTNDAADASSDVSEEQAEAALEEDIRHEEEEPQEEIVYEFTEVDDDYFLDAAFIGDSRTVGLSEYCEELDTRADFYSKVSLTIFDVMKKEFIPTENGKIGLEQALSEKQYGKIYIMLGLNEIGTGDAQYFKDAYAEVVDRIKELQPDAIIYIQGIMHVTGKKSNNDKYFNNDNINARNEAISELADQKQVFFIDMNESVDDEEGNLDSALSFDDVHLRASSYERWHQYLLQHAIVR